MLSQGILTVPIEIREIYQCLGAGALNGTWYDIGHICTHVNINKWAKFKPTDYPSRSAGSAVTYVGADGLCGLDCAPSTNLQTVIDRVRLGNYDWAYSKRPNGVGQSFYRMLDFEFYDHKSIKPLYPLGDLYGNIGSGSLQKRYFNDPANGVTLNLHLNQMSYQGVSFADMYWAIVFIDSNNNLHAGCMSTDKMGNTNEVPIPLYSPYFTSVANYKGICLLTNVHRDFTSFKNGGSWGTDAFYIGLPIPAFNMSVVDRSLLSITCHAEYAQNDSGINFDIYGTNLTDADASTGQITIQVIEIEIDGGGDMHENLIYSYTENAVTIAKGSDMTDLRLGGHLDSSVFYDWHPSFTHQMNVICGNTTLGQVTTEVVN